MSLVDWQFLDRMYNDTVDAIISRRRDKASGTASSVEKFEAWLSSKNAPLEYRELLNVLKSVTASGLQPIMRFSTEVFSRWPDVRQDVNGLQQDNSKLVAERHRYRQNAWNDGAQTFADTQALKVRTENSEESDRYRNILQNLTRNVNAYRLAIEQFGPGHPETEAAFESLEHANAEASKEIG